MQLVDANVLLYGINRSSAHHRTARVWLDDALNGSATVAFTWIALLAFLRLSTHPAVFPRPLTFAEASEVVRAWLSQPTAVVVEPSDRHMDLMDEFLSSAGTAGNLVNDAHLAALSVEHGAEIVSFDADFGRFSGVSVLHLGRTS